MSGGAGGAGAATVRRRLQKRAHQRNKQKQKQTHRQNETQNERGIAAERASDTKREIKREKSGRAVDPTIPRLFGEACGSEKSARSTRGGLRPRPAGSAEARRYC